MILDNQVLDTRQVGIQGSYVFKVQTSAKMMKLLSDSLYSDKISAVIRELSANASDSHVAAGCPQKPFDVTLPTYSKLEFRIRDYGTGLSLKDLTELYTTYGDSNRNESNEYTGAMGIGSKSPFAYTDSFTVISYHKGNKYVCIVAKDSAGIPTLNIMEGVAAEEEDGMDISFIVKSCDTSQFLAKAKKIYQYFTTKPNIIGYSDFKYDKKEVIFSGKDWKIYNINDSKSYAIMGNIGYPIDGSHFTTGYNVTTYSKILSLGVELSFNIGDIDIDISREGLQYNPSTLQAVKARLQTIYDELSIIINDKFKACKSLWEARCQYRELCATSFYNLTTILPPKWNNISITDSIRLDSYNYHFKYSYIQYNNKFTTRKDRLNFTASKDIKFCLNDVETGVYALLEHHYPDNKVYILHHTGAEDALDKDLKEVCKEIGIPKEEIIIASSLPKVKRDKIIRGPIKQYRFLYNTGYSRNQSVLWHGVTVDLDSGGYYVELLSSFDIQNGDNVITSSYLNNILHFAESVKIYSPTKDVIYGFRPTQVKKIKNDPSWVNFLDEIRNRFSKLLITSQTNITILKEKSEVSALSHNYLYNYLLDQTHNIPHNSICKEFIENYGRVKNHYGAQGTIDNLSQLAQELKIDMPKIKSFNFPEKEKILKTRYPIIQLLDQYKCTEKNVRLLVEYINMVEKS